jgi:hypothetical protein
MKRIVVLVLISIVPFPAISIFAQDAKSDIEKINKAYLKDKYTLYLEYKAYENHSTDVPLQVENCIVRKNGEQLYYKLGSIESIQQSNYSIVTDHEEKIIALLPRKYDLKRDNILPIQLDSVLKQCKKIEFQKVSADVSAYTFEFLYSQFAFVRVEFSPRTYQINKMLLFYEEPENLTEEEGAVHQPPRLEIVYKKFDSNPTFTADQFTYKTFLVKTGDDYKPKEVYKDYEVVNQM